MQSKTVIVFWASTAGSIFLLGGTIAAADSALRDPSTMTVSVLALSIIGLVFAGTIAVRIVLVIGRSQRGRKAPKGPQRGRRWRRSQTADLERRRRSTGGIGVHR